MSLTESFDSFVQRLQRTVHGSAGIFKKPGQGDFTVAMAVVRSVTVPEASKPR